jgi:L-lactate dehydrogenase complex protein LldF
MLNDFLKASNAIAFDKKHRSTLRYNIAQYENKFATMQAQFTSVDKARRMAKNLKWNTMEQLDRYLLDFERNFQQRGGRVLWAVDADEACRMVLQIAEHYQVQRVVKAKSMVTEEICLNAALEKNGISVLETDLGEYVAQLNGERPYHVTAPILQKTKQEVAATLHKTLGTPLDATPQEMTNAVRTHHRYEYLEAEMGITGANFLVADTGSVVVTENEGNARLCTAFPRVHIAIAGIEKVLPSAKQLQLFLPLLATHSTGQRITAYNTLYNGPRQKNETDGPEAMFVILLDNGRTKILADTVAREALYCIRCGACQNMCPVYRTVGGHTFGGTYAGPIGAAIAPHLDGLQQQGHLADASSLCGRCSEVCPVAIDLHGIILHNRQKVTDEHLRPEADTKFWNYWQEAMLRRWLLDIAPSPVKKWGFKHFFAETWGKSHKMPEFPPKTFAEMWKEKH